VHAFSPPLPGRWELNAAAEAHGFQPASARLCAPPAARERRSHTAGHAGCHTQRAAGRNGAVQHEALAEGEGRTSSSSSTLSFTKGMSSRRVRSSPAAHQEQRERMGTEGAGAERGGGRARGGAARARQQGRGAAASAQLHGQVQGSRTGAAAAHPAPLRSPSACGSFPAAALRPPRAGCRSAARWAPGSPPWCLGGAGVRAVHAARRGLRSRTVQGAALVPQAQPAAVAAWRRPTCSAAAPTNMQRKLQCTQVPVAPRAYCGEARTCGFTCCQSPISCPTPQLQGSRSGAG
jgi:hypothetical protein